MVPEGTIDVMFSYFFIDNSYQIMEEVALSFLNWALEVQQIFIPCLTLIKKKIIIVKANRKFP